MVRALSQYRKEHWYWLVLLLCLLPAWLGVSHLPLFDEDEGEYGEVAMEMANSHDYITPTLNGQPFYEKPILAFWCIAPLLQLFGEKEWVFRLPSVLACLLWSLSLFLFCRKHFNTSTARWATGFSISCLGINVSGLAATMDGLLGLLMTWAAFDIFTAWQDKSRWPQLRTYIWMGLGFLLKGPIAIAIPFTISLVFYAKNKQFKQWLTAIFDPLGWLILIIIVLPWYAIQYHLMGAAFIDDFFWRENVGRFTSSLQGHSGPIYYYLPVLLILISPYSSLIITTIRGIYLTKNQPNALRDFLIIWFLCIFIIFSLSHTKLPHYLLVGLTPIFILIAQYRDRLKTFFVALIPILLLFLVALLLPYIAERIIHSTHDPYIRAMMQHGLPYFNRTYWCFIGSIAGIGIVLWWIFRKSIHRGWQCLPIAGFIQQLLLWGVLLPTAAFFQQKPIQDAASFAQDIPQNIVADSRMPSFAIYQKRPTLNKQHQSGDIVLVRQSELHNLNHPTILFEEGGVLLVRLP